MIETEKKETMKESTVWKVLMWTLIIGTVMLTLTCTTHLYCGEPSKFRWDQLLLVFLKSMGLLFLIAGSALLTGCFLGFIFGLPKYHKTYVDGDIEFSTSLTQISDWLTKIIVGVGLTQLYHIPNYIVRIGQHISQSTLKVDAFISENTAIAVILYFSIIGFSISYLWTFLEFPRLFKNTDKAVNAKELSQIKEEVKNEVKEELDFDRKADTLVNKQLSLKSGEVDVPVDEIANALEKASASVSENTYYKISRINKDNSYSSAFIKNIIPIVKALIKNDSQKKHFENYFQIAYAYIYLDNPDYIEALKYIEEGLKMRPADKKNDWLHFELAKAECLIMKFEKEKGNLSTINEPDTHEKIVSLLNESLTDSYLQKFAENDVRIIKWMNACSLKIENNRVINNV